MTLNFDNILDKIFSHLKEIADDYNDVFVIRNIFGRIGIYFPDAQNIAALQEKIKGNLDNTDWIENIEAIAQNTLLYDELKKICMPVEPQKIFFGERRTTRLNWFTDEVPENRETVLKGLGTKIITFYSYKGGVGRTTALVASALEQVRKGKTIVLVDFDIEAPGLAALFYNEEYWEEYSQIRGVTEFLVDAAIKKNMTVDDLEDYYFSINDTDITGSEGGKLIIFPAAVTSGEQADNYLEKLSRIDLNMSYYRGPDSPVTKLFQLITRKFAPDFIFVDSRTGTNDIGGLALTKYSHLAVLFFYGSEQNMFGLRVLLPMLKDLRVPVLLVNSPVPLNESDREDEIDYYISRSYEIFCQHYYDNDKLPDRFDKSADHYPIEVPYNPEAVIIDSPAKIVKILKPGGAGNPYTIIANHIDKITVGEEPHFPYSGRYPKEKILKAMSEIIPEITASSENEFPDIDNLKRNFYPRKDYKFIFEHDRFLILGEKGVGKTALFFVLSHGDYARNMAEFCGIPGKDLSSREWLIGLENTDKFPSNNNFAGLESLSDTELRNYWFCLLVRSIARDDKVADLLEHGLPSLDKLNNTKLKDLKHLAGDIDFIEELEEWFADFQENCREKNKNITIIYDYLDSRVSPDNKSRGRIIAALISYWFENLPRYKNIRAKIFLRQDIFDREVENSLTDKVKIRNYSQELKWEYDQLLNIVWKRVIENDNELENYFKDVLDNKFILSHSDRKNLGIVPIFSEEGNRLILDKFLGNYMGGNNKAFPYNWIRYHISDTNGNITPRSILTLFAVTARNQLNDKKEYHLIIRPYNMELAQTEVSRNRIQDLKEEFPEFKDIFDKLKEHVRDFPVEENDLEKAIADIRHSTDGVKEIIIRLMAIGIIKSYKPKKESASLRYHIPDMYLIEMGLKRRGPGFHRKFLRKKL